MISQRKLKSILSYNPESGSFIWLKSSCNRARLGEIAGRINSNGYRTIGINGKSYLSHRLVFVYEFGFCDATQIDHINGIRSDNRISNLRVSSVSENQKNQRIGRNNKSGFIGVHFDKSKNKWAAAIGHKSRQIKLGSFEKKEDAVKARKAANKKYNYHKNHGIKYVI
tara:strand:- start:131 stop:634 length:504 start_codon:yes stop_codon:yes gene_type:complete